MRVTIEVPTAGHNQATLWSGDEVMEYGSVSSLVRHCDVEDYTIENTQEVLFWVMSFLSGRGK